MDKKNTYLEEVEREVEKRVGLLESEDYVFVPTMSKSNMTAALILGIASFVSIVIVYQIYC